MAKEKENDRDRRLIFRLYRQFDIDLLYLYSAAKDYFDDDIGVFIKKAIRAFIRGKKQLGPDATSAWTSGAILNGSVPQLKKRLQFHVMFSAKDDADILRWIDSISKGYRNHAVKEVVRWYINDPVLFPALLSTRVEFNGGTKYKAKPKQSKEELFSADYRRKYNGN